MFTWIRRFLRLNSMVLGLLLTIIVGLLCWFDTLHSFELWVSDFRFKVRGALLPGSEVVIAAIDEKSLKELGRWPWPYTVQADLVRRLTAYGAAAIGYDVVFSESDTSAGLDNMQALDTSLAAHGYYDDAELKARVAHVLAKANHDQIFATAPKDSERNVLG